MKNSSGTQDSSEKLNPIRARTLRDSWKGGFRWLKAGGDPLRFRVALSGVAFGLALWLISSADKPWKFDLARAADWKLSEIVGFYSFWAGALNLALLGVLIGTARWWADPGERASTGAVTKRPLSAVFWIAVLGAMALAGLLSSKRLDFGLAHDEDLSARRAIVGEYRVAEDGNVLPPRLKWQNTFFDYRKPTNHVLYSVLARSAWTTWRIFAPEDWYLREWIIRLPAWLAGIFAVMALALLAARLGGELAGVVSAWLLALHPWFLRYASEARGYAVLLLIVPVTLLVWLRATREDLWRWWLAFGACQFMLLWVYPAAIYILVVLNGLTALWLAREWSRRSGDTRFRRWLAANLMAAIPANQMMLPLVPQLLNYLQTAPEARQPLKLSWLLDTSSSLLVGAGWNKSGSLNSPYIELAPRAHDRPLLFASLLALLAIAAIVGVPRMARWKWPQGAIVVFTLLAPAAIAAGVAKATNEWLFEWYLIYLLPGLVAVVAIGVCGSADGRLKFCWRIIAAMGILVAYAGFSQPIRARICGRPMDPIKEVVMSMRGTLKPTAQSGSERLTASFPHLLSYYDPHAQRVKTATDLQEAMRESDKERKPLYVTAFHPWGVVFGSPEVWRLFYESGLFVDFVIHHGMDNVQDRVVARYQPGAIEGFDVEGFLRGKTAVPNPMQPPTVYPQTASPSENVRGRDQ
jgi:Dolichyl-phosphate-mannose-protein mannosyltransferase